MLYPLVLVYIDMKKKLYCFECDKNVDFSQKSVENTYSIHNVQVKMKEKEFYCNKCNNMLTD